VGTLVELLAEHERAAEARVAALSEQIAVLSGELAVATEAVSRLRITCETVAEVLGGAPPDGVAVPTGGGADGMEPASGLLVPHRAASVEVSALPRGYRDVLEVLADAGRPLRAGEISVALGLGSRPSNREGMRSKCRRLVERGWLAVDGEGLFALAGGVVVRTGESAS
jgi:hypothetical protein